MAIYKNLIVGCSLGAGTLLLLISTQLSNTIIPTQNVTSTQEPPRNPTQNPGSGISMTSEQNSQVTPTNHPPIVYNQTIDTEQLTSKNFTLKGEDPDNQRLIYVEVSGPFHGHLRIINSTIGIPFESHLEELEEETKTLLLDLRNFVKSLGGNVIEG